MDAKDLIRSSLTRARYLTTMILGDVTDADLMVRVCPGANHIAWQLGHLATSEHRMFSSTFPGKMPALPADFAEKHSKQTAAADDPAGFLTKDEYLKIWDEQRQATMAILDEMDPIQLDEPTPEALRPFAPTKGELFGMATMHEVMHMGQFSATRRKLGKPHVF